MMNFRYQEEVHFSRGDNEFDGCLWYGNDIIWIELIWSENNKSEWKLKPSLRAEDDNIAIR